MAMTNAALKQIFNTYGARIKALQFEAYRVMMNPPKSARVGSGWVTNDQIEFKTFGDQDFILIPTTEAQYGNPITQLVQTERLVRVIITDKETDMVDPYVT